jgi:hypothetical protein
MTSANEKITLPDGPREGTAVTVGSGVTRTVAELQEADVPTTTEELREQIRPGTLNRDKHANPDSPATDRFPPAD